MNERRGSYLLKNTAIFALGTIGTKMISFFLVPLYTNILTTAQYGVVDLVTTLSTLLGPILTLNISEAVMRFALDKGADRVKIMSTGLAILLMAIVVGIVLIPIAKMVETIGPYAVYLYFYAVSLAGSQIFLCYLRGKEKLAAYSLGNILYAFLTAMLNLYFLLYLKQGIEGYFKAYILANVVTIIYAFITGDVWKVVKNFHLDRSLSKAMAKFSAVLIPNSFMWWIMNSSSRVMITSLLGSEQNGIYAVAFKIPTILTTMMNVFTQAWLFSAVRENESKDRETYSNLVLKDLIAILLIAAAGVLMILKGFMRIYVDETYFVAWKYVPILLLGVVFSVLGTFLSTSYTVNKDSKGFLFSAICGASVHLVLSFLLIPQWGCMGAAIATCASYIGVFLYRVFDTKKYLKLRFITWRNSIGFAFVLLGLFALYAKVNGEALLLSILFVAELFLFRKEWVSILRGVFKRKS